MGSDAVREKLEEIKREATGRRVGQVEKIAAHVSEALALLDSEPSEQVCRDHAAMEALRGYAATGARPLLAFDDGGSWVLTFAGIQPVAGRPDGVTTSVLRATWATDPADATLVHPPSEEAEGE